jgi:hypothetical protein
VNPLWFFVIPVFQSSVDATWITNRVPTIIEESSAKSTNAMICVLCDG